jgi:hypothetical protein
MAASWLASLSAPSSLSLKAACGGLIMRWAGREARRGVPGSGSKAGSCHHA